TFIFLSIFFSLVYLISKSIGQNFPFSTNTLLESFALTQGTGYVWIIRVFILVAIALPFLIKIYNKLNNKKFYLPILLIAYFLYEIIFRLYFSTHIVQNIPVLNYFTKYIIFYIIPYGIVAGVGFYITKMNSKTIAFFALVFAGI